MELFLTPTHSSSAPTTHPSTRTRLRREKGLNKKLSWIRANVQLYRSLPFFLGLMGLLLLTGCSGEQRPVPSLQQDPVLDFVAEVIFYDTAQQEITRIDAAVADDDRERAAGLMNVRSLEDNQGMIFLFDRGQPRSFWMMNTFLSLDIVYVNEAMEIVRIHRYTTPFSQEGILSEKPAKYVVEVKAGFTVVHDINEGDSISYSIRENG